MNMKNFVQVVMFFAAGIISAAAGEIHVASDATAAERAAAKDFAAYFERVTGKSLALSPYTVYLGQAAKEAKWFQMPETAFEEWVIESNGDELVITGDVRGTVWGVYEFLEKHLGCAFLANDTEVVPSCPNWRLTPIKERHRPAFFRREMSSGAGGPRLNHPVFRMKRKENVRTPYPEIWMHSGSPKGCHTFASYVENWPANGPFAVGSDGKSPCYSNPEARKLFAEKLKNYIEKDREGKPRELWPMIYSIDQNDGFGNNCKCAQCRQYPTPADANVDFINAIAAAIEPDYPEVIIQTFAYQHTLPPPQQHKARPNVIIRFCGSEITAPLLPGTEYGDALEAWRQKADQLALWSYWKPYTGEETPYLKPRKIMQQELQYCRDSGVRTYYAENEKPYVRNFWPLQYYLWSHLVINPDCDIENLSDTFFRGYYGKAAPQMKEFCEYLEKRMAAIPWQARGNVYSIFDREFFDTANRLLDAAEQAAVGDEKSLRHVRWERVPVDHALLMRQDKFPLGDRQDTVINRWLANAKMVREQFALDAEWRKNLLKPTLAELDNEVALFRAMPFPIPEQFQGKKIQDFHWPDFDPWNGHKRYLVDDPDASSGKAFTLRNDRKPKVDGVKHKAVHELPLSIGLYDSTAPKKQQLVAQYYWNRGDYASDEKYHWYKLGEAVITPNLRIYVHWSWNCRIFLRKGITGIDQNIPKEIWASIKITGPAYVEGSTQTDGIFIDRVILVEK